MHDVRALNELVAQVGRAGRPYVLVPTFHAKKNAQNATLLALQSQHQGHVTETLIPQDNKAVECVLTRQPVTRFASPLWRRWRDLEFSGLRTDSD